MKKVIFSLLHVLYMIVFVLSILATLSSIFSKGMELFFFNGKITLIIYIATLVARLVNAGSISVRNCPFTTIARNRETGKEMEALGFSFLVFILLIKFILYF